MRVYCMENYKLMSRKASAVISAHVICKPHCVLGLATGSTPIGLYEALRNGCQNGDLDFSRVTTVNLDEYVGLDEENSQSYRYFMNKNLFDHLNINKENTHLPNGRADNLDAECERYENLIRDVGPLDLQLLGMGHNGHIGFNEPSDQFIAPTHVVSLTKSTIQANARFFESEDQVPRKALTMGMRAIMQANTILLVVSGKDKAEIVKEALTGPVTPKVPASILQLHRNLIVVGDKDALSGVMDS